MLQTVPLFVIMKGKKEEHIKNKMDDKSIFAEAKRVLQQEIDALKELYSSINEDFIQLVHAANNTINTNNKIIIIGLGKSGLIAKKIVATLNSLNLKSVYLHPVEAVHGDFGIIAPKDLCLFISNSGESIEIINLLNHINEQFSEITTVALTNKPNSTMSKKSQLSCQLTFSQEACPFNLIPTSSAIVTLAFGDCLALALVKLRNIDTIDYAKNHPAGTIGQTLNVNITDIMRTDDRLALVSSTKTVQDAIIAISYSRGGIAIIIDEKKSFQGILTLGDLNRGLSKNENFLKKKLTTVFNQTPKTIYIDESFLNVTKFFKTYKINSIPILNRNNTVAGLIDRQDLSNYKF